MCIDACLLGDVTHLALQEKSYAELWLDGFNPMLILFCLGIKLLHCAVMLICQVMQHLMLQDEYFQVFASLHCFLFLLDRTTS